MEVIKAVNQLNNPNRVKKGANLDKLRKTPNLKALMNSKLDASFFVELLAWRAKILAKNIIKILALKLANLQHKIGQCTG